MERFQLAVQSGAPVNPPIWWVSPNDKTAQTVADQYMLGDTILVAPVVEEGKTTRNVYLPAGTWKDGNSDKTYTGPTTVPDYSAPIDILPFFIKQLS